MTFSHTQPLVVHGPTDSQLDPLYEAWNRGREARRAPLELGLDVWAREVSAYLDRVRDAVASHVLAMESSDSPVMNALNGDPERAVAVQLELAEHARMAGDTSAIADRLRNQQLENIDVLAVTEELIELEITLARHLNRLHEILGSVASA